MAERIINRLLMKSICRIALLLTFLVLTALSSGAQTTNTVLDDTWADGTYTNSNVPTDSPWFFNTSTAGTFLIGSATNSMYLTNYDGVNSSTKYFWTYFTTNAPELTVNLTSTNIISNNTN